MENAQLNDYVDSINVTTLIVINCIRCSTVLKNVWMDVEWRWSTLINATWLSADTRGMAQGGTYFTVVSLREDGDSE